MARTDWNDALIRGGVGARVGTARARGVLVEALERYTPQESLIFSHFCGVTATVVRKSTPKYTGITAVTTSEIFIVGQGPLLGVSIANHSLLTEVEHIEYADKGIVGSYIYVHALNWAWRLAMDSIAGRELYAAVRRRQKPPEMEKGTGGRQPQLSDELIRLVTLRAEGILSEEEFTAAKRRVLGL